MSEIHSNANLVRTSIAQFSSHLQRSESSNNGNTQHKKISNKSASNKKRLLENQQDDDEVCLVGNDDDDQNPISSSQKQFDGDETTDDDDEEDDEEEEDDRFQLPTLPKGKIIVCKILSSWASPSSSSSITQQQAKRNDESAVVGLSGIEFFDQNGDSILGIPSCNIVPLLSCSNHHTSPSAVLFPLSNLLKEPFDTTDTTKMWVVSQSKNETTQLSGFAIILSSHSSSIHQIPTTLSAIRIWNFNCTDRAHLSWGAKEMEIFLDETKIFRGEIRQSAGDAKNEIGVETILFTENVDVLTKIAEQAEERSSRWDNNNAHEQPLLSIDSPKNSKNKDLASSSSSDCNLLRKSFVACLENDEIGKKSKSNEKNSCLREGIDYFSVKNNLEIVIADNWHEDSSSKAIALSGIQFLDENGNEIQVISNSFEIFGGWSKNKKSVSQQSSNNNNLFDGNPDTFFLIENIAEFPIILSFKFPQSESRTKISALRIANFSGSSSSCSKTTFLGIKHFRIRIDGNEILDGFKSENCKSVHSWLIARKAPAGSYQMNQILYQTFHASSIYWGGGVGITNNKNGNSLSSSSSSTLLSASMTALAKVAILRSKYLSGNNNDNFWPSWINPKIVDVNVPFFPTGYVFSISTKKLLSATNQHNSNNLLQISNVKCFDEDGEELKLDFVCNNNNHGDHNNKVTTFIAFETIRTISVISFDFTTTAAATTSDEEVDVAICSDDDIIYGNLFSTTKNRNTIVIPFVPDEKILSRFKQFLC